MKQEIPSLMDSHAEALVNCADNNANCGPIFNTGRDLIAALEAGLGEKDD